MFRPPPAPSNDSESTILCSPLNIHPRYWRALNGICSAAIRLQHRQPAPRFCVPTDIGTCHPRTSPFIEQRSPAGVALWQRESHDAAWGMTPAIVMARAQACRLVGVAAASGLPPTGATSAPSIPEPFSRPSIVMNRAFVAFVALAAALQASASPVPVQAEKRQLDLPIVGPILDPIIGDLPIVGGLLGGSGAAPPAGGDGGLLGSLPIVGGLLGGNSGSGGGLLGLREADVEKRDLVDGLPIVGPIVGPILGDLPIVGGLLGGDSGSDGGLLGSLPIGGGLLGGNSGSGGGLLGLREAEVEKRQLGDLPIVGPIVEPIIGDLPIVGGLLGGENAGGDGGLLGSLPIVGGLLGGNSGSGGGLLGLREAGVEKRGIVDGLPIVGPILDPILGGLPIVGTLLGGAAPAPTAPANGGGLLGLPLGLVKEEPATPIPTA
ncbi:hypothetical protein C8Q77DRAFT_1162315 [Trametes polyzona]|nr:hypothetical protein C8Q77DRAFT_1162315 [Trametes polyzona]